MAFSVDDKKRPTPGVLLNKVGVSTSTNPANKVVNSHIVYEFTGQTCTKFRKKYIVFLPCRLQRYSLIFMTRRDRTLKLYCICDERRSR